MVMDKESFILQTTRTGRLPTNAVFGDEKTARLEAEKAFGSGAFEHVRLTAMNGAEKKMLVDLTVPKTSKVAPKTGKVAASKGAGISTPALIGRISMLITLMLIAAVIYYLAQPYLK
jgi:hypothetical protein